MTQARLEEVVEDWAGIVAHVSPFGGTELLESARSHVVQSWWDYQFMVTGCMIGFQAVEATFHQVLYPDAPDTTPFRRLVDRAEDDGWFNRETADILRAGVELRNHLAHPQGMTAFTVGMTDSILRVCHLVVRDICFMRGLTTSPQADRGA
jgi:hypothetical protein